MIGLRNDHSYGEPWEYRRLRLREQADERHGVDSWKLADDHERCYWPAEPACAAPVPVLAGSRKNPANHPSSSLDAPAGINAAGEGDPCSPAAPSSRRRAA